MTELSLMSFEELRAQPNGPAKKFHLIKNFRAAIVAQTSRDPREFGCDALCAMIEAERSRSA